jgi:hypothetical protein
VIVPPQLLGNSPHWLGAQVAGTQQVSAFVHT